jgi:hypothetical protein
VARRAPAPQPRSPSAPGGDLRATLQCARREAPSDDLRGALFGMRCAVAEAAASPPSHGRSEKRRRTRSRTRSWSPPRLHSPPGASLPSLPHHADVPWLVASLRAAGWVSEPPRGLTEHTLRQLEAWQPAEDAAAAIRKLPQALAAARRMHDGGGDIDINILARQLCFAAQDAAATLLVWPSDAAEDNSSVTLISLFAAAAMAAHPA